MSSSPKRYERQLLSRPPSASGGGPSRGYQGILVLAYPVQPRDGICQFANQLMANQDLINQVLINQIKS